ncbi:NUDIX hydrolase [Nocardioides campestrisoli]|uniref:NUDIX hydrolase n=1 Tax=Nocardioides campestrisoli TaxID=2736757 RepID=UPI0015E715C1|nr:NUDIX domain-containing protein [Nocardioides campestrisoli]
MATHGPGKRDDTADVVVAAGAVVTRRGGEVLLVHRPRYDDWSFPKGKLDPGEHVTGCAVREVEEETGLRVRLGVPLPVLRYRTGGREKVVHYWCGRVVGDDSVEGHRRADEIDEAAWVSWREAERRLSYDRDREVLAHAREQKRRTRALVVLRHAQAHPRKAWTGDDRRRPLSPEGIEEAKRLVPVLAAYDVTRVVTSSATRCVDTVVPYAADRLALELTDGLTEEEATDRSVLAVVDDLLEADEGAALCTHRPVLPSVQDALELPETRLEKAGFQVVHHAGRRVVAVEAYDAP